VERKDHPLHEGCKWTVLQACYWGLSRRAKRHTTDEAFVEDCTTIRAYLPQPNLYPPSRHVMEGVLGVKNWDAHERHVCGNPACTKGHSWEHTPRAEWPQHEEDKCPWCQAPRFERVPIGSEQVIQPVSIVIYFGLEDVIKNQFFGNPDWCENRGKGRDESCAGYWGSAEKRRMNEAVRGLVRERLKKALREKRLARARHSDGCQREGGSRRRKRGRQEAEELEVSDHEVEHLVPPDPVSKSLEGRVSDVCVVCSVIMSFCGGSNY
jgi:hypothetical protein